MIPKNSKLLFLDFSVDDHYMILRAKVVNNSPEREFSMPEQSLSRHQRLLLRDNKDIVSKEEAREQYLNA